MPRQPTRASTATFAKVRLACAATAALIVLTSAGSRAEAFTPVEAAAILRHGPWPPPVRKDPSNPASGNADAIALGKLLFFDARMSPSGRVACSSCHRPEQAWTDGRRTAIGLARTRRNTPTLLDVSLHRRFGWTGGAETLWQQSIRPILDPAEMGSSAGHVKAHIAADAARSKLYSAVFGAGIEGKSAPDALLDAARALAAYQETIVSPRTRFDALHDAVASNDAAALSNYPAAARRGLSLFVGAAGCSACHSGPAFTDGKLHTVSRVSSRLASERYRTPPLRGTARTAPYMHDGAHPTLAAAVKAHTSAARLRSSEIADLVAFLRTLSEPEK